ncbi:glutamate decarboxylase [Chiua virens]|nr:glutamate decarboxylase [Chiua virens]
MSLSKHVNPDRLVRESKDKKSSSHRHLTSAGLNTLPHPYGSRYGTESLPKFHLPSKGVTPDIAYQLIHDELSTDGHPTLNLASFVSTWMPEAANKLMMENMSKNLIDQDEYPATQIIHTRCVSILADLWHAPSTKQAIGTATTGSSEAIQLGGLAMKRIWQERRKAAGKSIHEPGPNIVMGANAQVALEKLVPVSVESKYRLDPKKTMEYVDENTIGVYVILGSTYTGHYEPVKEMSDLLDEYESRTGHSVPIHGAIPVVSWSILTLTLATVDGCVRRVCCAVCFAETSMGFQNPRVVSINASGHKFGLSYVGVGWVDLIFELHYLGSVEYSFSLNFSRPAAPIIAQYFNFLHLGFEGYRSVALDDLKNARVLSRALERTGWYTVLSDIHRPKSDSALDEENTETYQDGLPVVSFRFSDTFQQQHPEVEQRWIQTLLRVKGWIVPNYELPPNLETVQILRVVVRETFTEALVDRLVADIVEVTEELINRDSSAHALNILGKGYQRNTNYGQLDAGSGSEPSGTYAKPC